MPTRAFSKSRYAVLTALLNAPAVAQAATTSVATPACSVTLTKLSYDDPDADDAEFLELRVELRGGAPPLSGAGVVREATGAGAASCTPEAADGGGTPPPSPSPEAGVADGGTAPSPSPSPAPATLGDCGLSAIELWNGASGGCEAYRNLGLSAVPLPPSGYVVVCAADSSLAGAGLCDVTTDGHATLKNGWLQNGPSDGVVLVGLVGGAGERVELAYEGAPACFGAAALSLPEEKGVTTGADGETADDVAVLCGAAFTLLPEGRAPLHAENRCPAGPDPADPPPEGGPGRVSSDAAPAAAEGPEPDAAPWVPEFAPAAPSRGASSTPPPFTFDGGEYPQASSGAAKKPPSPPSCRLGRGLRSEEASASWLSPLFSVLVLARMARLRGRRRRGAR